MSNAELEITKPQEIWVDVYEAAEHTGYSVDRMRKIAQIISRKPEDQREIKMRKRTSRWELWLPDLFAYMDHPQRGPQRKRKSEST